MSNPLRTVPPICPGCGRFLRSAGEQRRGYCLRCPAPPIDAHDDERPCCQSDPPCDDCPFGRLRMTRRQDTLRSTHHKEQPDL